MKPIFALLACTACACATPSTWTFSIPPSTLVVTQWVVVQQRQPILYVIHTDENEWEFLADERLQFDPVVEVTISDLVAIDSSLVDFAHLKKGWRARREHAASPWESSVYR